MNDIQPLHHQGLSNSAISDLTGFNRRTVRQYLQEPQTPEYGPRPARASQLDPYKGYLQERLAAGAWNATVLLRELKARGYAGGYTILTDYLRPLRQEARIVAVRRFETPPGQQAQADWSDLGEITSPEGTRQKLYGFVLTLGHSRAMFCDIATDQKQATWLRLHETAFAYLGGVPHEILYDNMKTVVLQTLTDGVDGRGEVRLHPLFADFAHYWGGHPAVLPALPAADPRESRKWDRLPAQEFPVWLSSVQPGRSAASAAGLVGGGGQRPGPWHHPSGGG
ncbi:MAG: IS21 family transposase [Armatimonadetes bacterium]|nr:IS21 family transposase [Armatimonadota bacterium]